jgi:hypothetical protein
MKPINSILAFCSVLAGLNGYAQSKPPIGIYQPSETFSPIFYSSGGNEFRTAEGKPGPKYWQNHADYQINATIDTVAKSLTASENLSYTNNSPNPLTSLWLHIDQQIYRKDARAKLTGGSYSFDETTGGNQIISSLIPVCRSACQKHWPEMAERSIY